MKLAARLILLAALSISVMAPQTNLEAYGYQPDSQGYAYTDSTETVSNAPLAPLVVVGIAIAIGAILYVSQHGCSSSHHHHHRDPNHHHTHCHN
jgi:hypothetical protein